VTDDDSTLVQRALAGDSGAGDDDSTLVQRALAGDSGAGEALVARHFDAVWRVAFGITAHRSAADDVAQASFERAFRSLSAWSGEGELGAWLRRIAVNQGLDHLRKTKRRRAREVDLDPDDQAADWEESSRKAEVAAAIRGLDADRRTIVVLHHWLGYTLAESAELIGIPIGTAQSRLARAMTDLRDRLGVVT
jgi:RNA polymerase sigma-70 factor (ECF subfamily)